LETIGVVHLVQGLVFLGLVELLKPPVGQHLGVDHVLRDGRQFVGQQPVECRKDPFVAFHR